MTWLLRALLAAAVLLGFWLAAPAAGFGERLWLGQQVATHGIPLLLGHETFTAPGTPSGALGWLSAFGAYLVQRAAGPGGLALVEAAAVIATLALIELRARRRASPAFAAGALLLAALCFLDALHGGTDSFAWLCAAAFALLLDWRGPVSALASIGVSVLWCNLSPSGIFAPAIALLVALGRSIDGPDASVPSARSAWLVALACTLGTFATPGGWHYVALAPSALHLDGALTGLTISLPADVAPVAYRAGFFVCVVLLTFAGLRGSPAADALPALAAFLPPLFDGRFLPLLGVVSVPVIAAAVHRAVPLALHLRPAARVFAIAAAACLAIAAGSRALPPDPNVVPAASLARFVVDAGGSRLVCTRLVWCGDVVAAGVPGLRVFMDDRAEAYPPAIRDRQRTIVRGRGKWREALKAARVDAVLVGRRASLAGLLDLEDGWKSVGRAGDARLYLRRKAGS